MFVSKDCKMLNFKKNKLFMILFLILVLLTISSSGCSENLENKNIEASNSTREFSDNYSFYSGMSHPFVELETGYFIQAYNALHYMDKATNEIVLFSNDPISMSELIDLGFEHGVVENDASFISSSIFYQNEKIYIADADPPDLSKPQTSDSFTIKLLEVDPKTHERKHLFDFQSYFADFILTDDKIFTIETIYTLEDVQQVETSSGESEKIESETDPTNSDVTQTDFNQQTTVEYLLNSFDLIANKKNEPIKLPTPKQYLANESSAPIISAYQNKVFVELNFTKYEEEQSQTNLYIYDVNSEDIMILELSNYELENPKNNQSAESIFNYAFLDEKMYLTKRNSNPIEPEIGLYLYDNSTTSFWVADLDGQNMKEFPTLEGDYRMISNGKYLYAIPSSFHQYSDELDQSQFLSFFSVYKFENDQWEKQYDVDTTDIGGAGARIASVALNSEGELFLYSYSGEEIFLVQKGIISKILDYQQYIDKHVIYD